MTAILKWVDQFRSLTNSTETVHSKSSVQNFVKIDLTVSPLSHSQFDSNDNHYSYPKRFLGPENPSPIQT